MRRRTGSLVIWLTFCSPEPLLSKAVLASPDPVPHDLPFIGDVILTFSESSSSLSSSVHRQEWMCIWCWVAYFTQFNKGSLCGRCPRPWFYSQACSCSVCVRPWTCSLTEALGFAFVKWVVRINEIGHVKCVTWALANSECSTHVTYVYYFINDSYPYTYVTRTLY